MSRRAAASVNRAASFNAATTPWTAAPASQPETLGCPPTAAVLRDGGIETRRVAGIAGLGYVVGVSIENMEILGAPTLGSPAADIRAHYANHSLAIITSFAGALALLSYVVFVVALFGLLRERELPGQVWSVLVLVGGIGGPLVAAAGIAASSVIVANSAAALSDGLVRALSDFSLEARIFSGIFVALFLTGAGVGSLRTRILPTWLGWLACAIAVPLALAPLAALTAQHGLEVAVAVAFGMQTLWIFYAALCLALADGVSLATLVRRAAFLVLAIAAGSIGIALLIVPGATGQFFAWGLGPEPLAGFAGGVYVGSAAAYAVALPRPKREVRGLVVGAVVLSVSVLISTLSHLDQFDFSRLQAWAWVVLFVGFALLMAGLLRFEREEPADTGAATPLAAWARLTLAALAVLLGVLAVALWIHPTGLGGPAPFDLSPLGGSFAGCWIALLATVAAWGAFRNTVEEAWLPALALASLPAGALVAAVRTVSDLAPAGAAAAYLAALALLAAAGALVLGSTRARHSPV